MLYLKVNLDVVVHIKSYQVGRQSRQGTSYKKQSPRTPILGAFFLHLYLIDAFSLPQQTLS
ncbi:hypothetical protein [Weissella paramesenteroides]|uniref:hypothetical protein n=1 Tax=Weissella paramesenteroides TaxID=1249 RepID=UPI002072ADF9|nr:hypothetical protein [Weissella paramesenteroides]